METPIENGPTELERTDLEEWARKASRLRPDWVARNADKSAETALRIGRGHDQRPYWREQRRSIWAFCWSNGWTLTRIAAVFERTRGTVSAVVQGRKR